MKTAEVLLRMIITHPVMIFACMSIATFNISVSSDGILGGFERNRMNVIERMSQLEIGQSSIADTRMAVEMFRKLNKKYPQLYQAELAASLNNLGVMLSDLGRYKEAIKVTREAVNIYRELSVKNPEIYQPSLAGSLSNLATMLADLGHYEEALGFAEKAVIIYRKLAKSKSKVSLPNLVKSLNNLALILFTLGRFEAAVEVARDAEEICRMLVVENPVVYLPDLAVTLNNLGVMLSKPEAIRSGVGDLGQAVKLAAEATQIYYNLAMKNPDVYSPYLAASLSNLGYIYYAHSRFKKALNVLKEAQVIFCEAARKHSVFKLRGAVNLDDRWTEFAFWTPHIWAKLDVDDFEVKKINVERTDANFFCSVLSAAVSDLQLTCFFLGLCR